MTERTEARLRDALRAEADDVDVDPGAWVTVQRHVRARRSRTARRAGFVAAAAAVVATIVGIGIALVRDDETAVDVRPADDVTTSTTAPVAEDAEDDETVGFDGIWPFWSQEQHDAYVADPGIGMFFDPEATALEFAREYLRMPDPVAPQGFRSAAGSSGWVEVNPRPGSPMVTRIWVHRYGDDDGAYAVYFAETANIQVDLESLTEPIVREAVGVSGTSTAFEATVDVEVREDGGRVLGRTFVMGGANGDFGRFADEVPIDEPRAPSGAVVFSTSSAEDGTLQEATVVRVRFEAADAATFSVFFHRGEELVEVVRTGPRTTGVLRQALEALVAGPRPEDGDGLSSLFSADTADVLAGVSIADGLGVVDLSERVDNASTSAGGVAFLAELDATVFQFPNIERVEYRLAGSCDAFWEWLQYGDCRIVERGAE